MRAIVLAAGVGKRLGEFTSHHPKCLLEFGGKTLLRYHLEQLERCGLEDVTVVTGYLAGQIEREASLARTGMPVSFASNPRYELGSALSLLTAAPILESGPSLVMDADLLYEPAVLDRLLSAPSESCLLVDGRLQDTGEEVKAVVREDGRVWELGKQVAGAGRVAGESVGMFTFAREAGAQLVRELELATTENPGIEYEPVIDRLIKQAPMGYAPVDDLVWVEIDFPEDVERARTQVLPRL